MKKNQKGFSAVEGILILVIIGVLGFVGWYVRDSKKEVDKTSQASSATSTKPKLNSFSAISPVEGALSTYISTSKIYSLDYPSDWSVTETSPPSGPGPGSGQLAEAKAVLFSSPEAPKTTSVDDLKAGVSVNVYRDVTDFDKNITSVLGNSSPGQPYEHVVLQINGNKAHYEKINWGGSYTDHNVYIVHDNIAIAVHFREKQDSSVGYPSTTYDDSASLPGFKTIVSSIKFE